MGKDKFTDEELELLTDEEREGLLDTSVTDDPVDDDDDDPDDGAAGAAAKPAEEDEPAGAGEGDAKDDDDDPDDGAAGAGNGGDGKPGDDGAAAAKPDGEGRPEPTPTPGMPQWQAPENAEQRLAEIEREKDELARKFDEGELTGQEFRAQLKPLDKEERELEQARFKASISIETVQHQWFNVTVPNFIAEHPEYAEGSPLYGALDVEVRKLQTEATKAGRSQLDGAILEQAHRNIQAGVRKALGLPAEEPKPKPNPDPAKTQKRDLPPSLNGLPADGVTDPDDGGKYAYLDRLADSDPIAFEDALAKLPEAEREAYLAAG